MSGLWVKENVYTDIGETLLEEPITYDCWYTLIDIENSIYSSLTFLGKVL